MILQIRAGSVMTRPAEGGPYDHSTRRTPEGRMTAMTDTRLPQRGQARTSIEWTLASSRAQALRQQSASTSRSFGVSEGVGSAAAFLPYQLAGARAECSVALRRSLTSGGVEAVAAYEMLPSRRALVTLRVTAAPGNVQRQLGDEIQRGAAADPALEEPRGGSGPGDGVLLLVRADAPQGKRFSHEVLTQSLARGLVEDAGPTLDREASMLPSEDLAGAVGIRQTLLEEQGDDAAAPDLDEGRGGSQGAA